MIYIGQLSMSLRFFISLIYLLGGETANDVKFMQPMIVPYASCYSTSLESAIAEASTY